MFSIKKGVFEGILKKKFNGMVGNLCELTETYAQSKGVSADAKEVRETIQKLKKFSYDTMREIEGQVEAFSNGTQVSVNFIRPDSK